VVLPEVLAVVVLVLAQQLAEVLEIHHQLLSHKEITAAQMPEVLIMALVAAAALEQLEIIAPL
jgi:hypothetical protein